MAYRVLIADDQIVARQLFQSIVASTDRYEIVDMIDTARIADSYCARGGVDLVIMDVVMNDGMSGLEAAERIKQNYPQIKVIIVTSMPDALFLRRAREIGADSFWYKEVQARPMLEVMDRTMAGEHIWPDRAPRSKLGQAESEDFTARELEVLRLLSEGLTDAEIAEKLFLGVTTVRYHVSNLMSKTGFSTRTELAVHAVRSGITIPGIQ